MSPRNQEPDFVCELAGLDEYAGTRRYEEGWMILSESDVLEIEQIRQQVMVWLNRFAKAKNPS